MVAPIGVCNNASVPELVSSQLQLLEYSRIAMPKNKPTTSAGMHRIWLLRLVPDFRAARPLTALVLFVLLYFFFTLGSDRHPAASGTPALFFSVTLAYIIPLFSYITDKAEEALSELKPILTLSETEIENFRTKLHSSSALRTSLVVLVSLVFALFQLTLIRGSLYTVISSATTDLTEFVTTLGAFTIWLVMSTAIAGLVQQAFVFAKLGKHHTHINLLNTRSLLPFARVSIYSSLTIIGALAFFPLMGFGTEIHLSQQLPGAIANLVPLIALFIVPIYPIHKHLVTLKQQELERIDHAVNAAAATHSAIDLKENNFETLLPLLNYRREIDNTSTWPFDVGSVSRISLYLIIPPLTWLGAALIENWVDSLL